MIDLASKDNKNNFFEVLYQGKSKTFISSSFTNGEIVALADWGGNIWAVEISSKKKLWEIKIKHPVLFEFVCYKEKAFVLNENTLFEIDVLTGLLTERASFKIVCSVLQKDNKIYLN